MEASHAYTAPGFRSNSNAEFENSPNSLVPPDGRTSEPCANWLPPPPTHGALKVCPARALLIAMPANH
jgi:hypothetical protein